MTLLRGRLDVSLEFGLLGFEFVFLAVEFAHGLFEGALVFAEFFLGGETFAEGPLYYLGAWVRVSEGGRELRWVGWDGIGLDWTGIAMEMG